MVMGLLTFLQACFSGKPKEPHFAEDAPIVEVKTVPNFPLDREYFTTPDSSIVLSGKFLYFDYDLKPNQSDKWKFVTAYNAQTGQQRWQSKQKGYLLDIQDEQVLMATETSMVFINLKDGKETSIITPIPLAIKCLPQQTIFAGDVIISQLAEFEHVREYLPDNKVKDDDSFKAGITAWELKTGRKLWHLPLPERGFYDEPFLLNNKIMLIKGKASATPQGQAYEMRELATGKILFEGKTEGHYYLNYERWIETANHHIKRLNPTDGSTLWTVEGYSNWGNFNGTTAVFKGDIGKRTAATLIDFETGALGKTIEMPADFQPVCIKDGIAYMIAYFSTPNFVSSSRSVYLVAYDLAQKKVIWRTDYENYSYNLALECLIRIVKGNFEVVPKK